MLRKQRNRRKTIDEGDEYKGEREEGVEGYITGGRQKIYFDAQSIGGEGDGKVESEGDAVEFLADGEEG